MGAHDYQVRAGGSGTLLACVGDGPLQQGGGQRNWAQFSQATLHLLEVSFFTLPQGVIQFLVPGQRGPGDRRLQGHVDLDQLHTRAG